MNLGLANTAIVLYALAGLIAMMLDPCFQDFVILCERENIVSLQLSLCITEFVFFRRDSLRVHISDRLEFAGAFVDIPDRFLDVEFDLRFAALALFPCVRHKIFISFPLPSRPSAPAARL